MELTADNIEDACRRLLPGYDAWQHDGSFYFDHAQALRACQFFQEVLTFTTGRWASNAFELQPWQAAIIGSIHGWRRKSDALRRYRRALITTARKCGKTPIAAGLGLYHLFADGESNPSICCAAGSAEQASIVYNCAANMVKNEGELQRRADVFARAINNRTNGGAMRFINSAAGTKHGTNESMVILDELHVIDDPGLADVLETSMRARRQPLAVYTSTAGSDPSALWAEIFDYANKVRERVIDDPEFLPCFWQASPDDDIAAPATWRKACPNLGVTVDESEYRRDLLKAQETARYLPVFKQLSLNLPTESHAAWIPYDTWRKCAGTDEPSAGAIAFGGVDLASTQDTTAFVLAFPVGDKVLVRPFVFLPQDNVGGLFRRMKRDKAPYETWARQGHLILTPGNVISFDVVIETILEQAKRYDIREIQMDPHAASNVADKLMAAGLNVTFVRQGWSLAEACRQTEAMIHAGKLVHPDSPVLNWQLSNAVVHTDRQENIWLDKAKSTRRIDAAVSLVMAVNAMKFGAGREASAPEQSYYEKHPGLIVL
jgi:phage terminase large subunit-like protein